MITKTNHIELVLKDNVTDIIGKRVQHEAQKFLSLDTGSIKTGKIYSVIYELSADQIDIFAHKGLVDSLLHDVYVNSVYTNLKFKSYILVSKLPGVTDDEGVSAQKTLCDILNLPLDTSTQSIFTQDLYYIENELTLQDLKLLAEDLLGNNLINHFEYGKFTGRLDYVPTVNIQTDISTRVIDINLSDSELIDLSKQMLLSLNLEEMKAIQGYYKHNNIRELRMLRGLQEKPTDCELEIFAQTWSEHCKHKEFNALIDFTDLESGKVKTIDSLFKTYIKESTHIIRQQLIKKGDNWLLKVFSDNAGVVRIDNDRVFIWKVETHNSPSALDPYGGALTGIVGVNRDPMGTGIGGAKLLFNTNVLCFGSPYYSGTLLSNQLHPRRIMTGVVKGIEDGGNKSGIPTVNGAIIFDDRFRGKPLVYCGTGAIMPAKYNGRETWEKKIDSGDLIVTAGGRVGKDGIHGATFSSLEIDEHSPRSAVQIGSPITQKNLSDFFEQACRLNLIKCSTDNGAGGLSSSIGELARISGGAIVQLDKVPLKYSGLKPWEIFVSESQERMTLVVETQHVEELFGLAEEYEVEVTEIGQFTDTGYLDVRYGPDVIAYLELEFLHEGVPKKHLQAEWEKRRMPEPVIPDSIDYNDATLRLLGSLNICSREPVIRRYDHEVKGKTIIKPLMGPGGIAPQDAAVMRLDFNSNVGIAISNGIIPRLGDIDAYQMSAGAFDEAVRQIVAVGGKLPDSNVNNRNRFWSVNDNFCVPDSVFNEETNPDGKYKLAQLVKMCEALFDSATFFGIPMTSGKDSMKNDFVGDGVKISIPPTILYSMVAKLDDVRDTVTAEFKHSGDSIYMVGRTFNELGASEFNLLFGHPGNNIPVVRRELARDIYRRLNVAQGRKLIASCHDISDGGMIISLIEASFGSNFGVYIDLTAFDLPVNAILFSESHSRFIVSVTQDQRSEFEHIIGQENLMLLGSVSAEKRIRVMHDGDVVIDLKLDDCVNAWSNGLRL